MRSSNFLSLLLTEAGKLEELRRISRALSDLADADLVRRRLSGAELEAVFEVVALLEGVAEPVRRSAQRVLQVATNPPEERLTAQAIGERRGRERLARAAKEEGLERTAPASCGCACRACRAGDHAGCKDGRCRATLEDKAEPSPAPAPVAAVPECGWRAGDCERTAKHLVTVRFRSAPVPMCDPCARIFDPELGAVGGYVREFMSRTPLEEGGRR